MVLFFAHIPFVVNHNQRNTIREVATIHAGQYNLLFYRQFFLQGGKMSHERSCLTTDMLRGE